MASFRCGRRSAYDGLRAAVQVLFKLHRAEVIQRRVQSCSVIPEQPIEDFILGLAKSFKVLAGQPFHLQGSEQALSQQLPLRLIEALMPRSLSDSWNC